MGFGGGDFAGGMSLGQFGYMEEATRFDEALREIVSKFKDGSDNDYSREINSVLRTHGISQSDLTSSMVTRIQNAIN